MMLQDEREIIRALQVGAMLQTQRTAAEMLESYAQTANPYWRKITQLADKQRAKGIRTYGRGIEENETLTLDEWITYTQEELIDALMYLERLRDKIAKKG